MDKVKRAHGTMTRAQLDNADRFAREAAAISRSQGLSPGKYDFTRLSQKQVTTICSDFIVNHGIDPEQMPELSDDILPPYVTSADQPFDHLKCLADSRAFAKSVARADIVSKIDDTVKFISLYHKKNNRMI
ncbi:hypothetical protein ACMGDM_08170 [Sphingomonas sp. DT-51]|uniref:hypothetical protein n=1 Tax=Sphingomonas sp. DT-51 TaxID=3396165 RepID=UPI003F1DA430